MPARWSRPYFPPQLGGRPGAARRVRRTPRSMGSGAVVLPPRFCLHGSKTVSREAPTERARLAASSEALGGIPLHATADAGIRDGFVNGLHP